MKPAERKPIDRVSIVTEDLNLHEMASSSMNSICLSPLEEPDHLDPLYRYFVYHDRPVMGFDDPTIVRGFSLYEKGFDVWVLTLSYDGESVREWAKVTPEFSFVDEFLQARANNPWDYINGEADTRIERHVMPWLLYRCCNHSRYGASPSDKRNAIWDVFQVIFDASIGGGAVKGVLWERSLGIVAKYFGLPFRGRHSVRYEWALFKRAELERRGWSDDEYRQRLGR